MQMIPEVAKDAIEYAVRRALGMGADYAEARFHVNTSSRLFMINGRVEALANQSSAGIGIRVVVEGCLSFGSTNNLNRVEEAVEKTVKGAKASLSVSKRVKLSEETFCEASYSSKVLKRPEEIPLEEKIELLKSVDEIAEEMGITSRNLSLTNSREFLYYFNSEGSRIEGDVTRLEGSASLTMVMGADSTQEFIGKGGSEGKEKNPYEGRSDQRVPSQQGNCLHIRS